MDFVALGALSAVSLGSADFLARFTSQRFGAVRSLLGVVVMSALVLTAYLCLTGLPTHWPLRSAWLLVAYGVATAAATLLLYEALARGPVTVAAPIVATHPAIIVATATLLGRPSDLIQWLAIAMTIGGAVVTASFASEKSSGRAANVQGTVLIAAAACVCYSALVVFGQMATPVYSYVQTVWAGRLVASVALVPLLWMTPERKGQIESASLALLMLIVQSALDIGGHLLLFAGSRGSQPHIVAVIASSFGAVTTLLGFFIVRERVSALQWSGIALVFLGVVVLSLGTHG